VLDFVREGGLVPRRRVLERFGSDDALSVSAVLHDLAQNSLIFTLGSAEQTVYRAAGDDELGEVARLSSEQGLDELAWVIVYREGPLATCALADRLGRTAEQLEPVLA
jgi:hypothetical protein